MPEQNGLVLSQYKEDSEYNDFIGKYYHFPGNEKKSYLNQFNELPVEFIYYEPTKNGKGEFFGYGVISNPPFEDKREPGYYFVEISEYKSFSKPVSRLAPDGDVLEEKGNPYYDAQNAVRRIPSTLLKEICLDGGILLNFESDAHLIKVLGEQLIGSEKVGILELIKNSIDAQSTYCRVLIEKIKNLPSQRVDFEFSNYDGPIIVVDDDGIGMTMEVIKNGWLRPASTLKTEVKEKLKRERDSARKSGKLGTYDALVKNLKKEHGGRLPLGEKGVGRFATHRLGRFLELRTKTVNFDYELVLRIDWNKFDLIHNKGVDLDSIGISLTRENPSRDYGISNSGTRLIIYGGREGFKWDRDSVEDLNRSILNLNSPRRNQEKEKVSFHAFLECPQIDDLPSEQIYESSTPNFELNVLINEKGVVESSELIFSHPTDKMPPYEWNEDDGLDLRIKDMDRPSFWIRNGIKRVPECGPFFMNMKVWYRRKEWVDIADYRGLAKYLADFGGMSIYRDDILVFDSKLGAETDWLGLTEDKTKNAYKISYRDFIGFIEIDQENNTDLIDKTNREGMISNQAFKDLSALSKNVVNTIVLPRYLSKRDEYNELMKGITSDSKVIKQVANQTSKLIGNISTNNYPIEEDPFSIFDSIWENIDDRRPGLVNLEKSIKELQSSIRLLEDVQDQFLEHAGFGISVAISLHEINKIATHFYYSVLHILDSGKMDDIELNQLQDTSKSLRTELKRLGPLRSIRNEKRITFSVTQSIYYASEIFKRRMKAKNIVFEVINPEKDFEIYGRYTALNQVFGNLFDNSIYWIENKSIERGEICVEFDQKYRTVTFADSGTGISDIIRPNLFQPGYSLKVPKSGLGLYICKSYLNSMKANIYETPRKDRIAGLDGAQFTLDFGKTPTKND